MDAKEKVIILEWLKELQDLLHRIAAPPVVEELIRLIHNPGFTTPRESMLTKTIVSSMLAHARELESMTTAMTAAAREIVAEGAKVGVAG